jgi:glycerophosphoryl diester phosphodiesterase
VRVLTHRRTLIVLVALAVAAFGYQSVEPVLAAAASSAPSPSPLPGPGPGGARPAPPRLHTALILAHRGGLERAEENSMAAFEDAIASRVDYVETDVRHSADGVAFLVHDRTLPARCTPYAGQPVTSLTAAQLYDVRCDGQPLALLSELVTRLR